MELALKCQFRTWKKRKQKFATCKNPICKNENNLPYCGNHLPDNEVGPNGKMLRCDICKQLIGDKIYEKHLKKCEKIRKLTMSVDSNIITPRIWHKKDIKACDIPSDVLVTLSQKLLEIKNKFNLELKEDEIIPQFLFNCFDKNQLEGKNGKHIYQEGSIIAHMENEGILIKDATFIEFGCGAGALSRTIQLSCDRLSSHVLIDRMKYTSKNKFDLELSCNGKYNVERLVIDIENANLEKYIHLPIIGCSKHLCGGATDLTLKILSASHNPFIGIAIATCCHYLLTFDSCINQKFFEDNFLTKEEVEWMARITSWSTLKEESEKKNMGQIAKIVLDYSRLEYLNAKGFDMVKLVKYTSKSKENHLILAKRSVK